MCAEVSEAEQNGLAALLAGANLKLEALPEERLNMRGQAQATIQSAAVMVELVINSLPHSGLPDPSRPFLLRLREPESGLKTLLIHQLHALRERPEGHERQHILLYIYAGRYFCQLQTLPLSQSEHSSLGHVQYLSAVR